MYQGPYNGAVLTLTKVLGPMPGTYTGPYPAEDEAAAAVARGSVILAEELVEDRITVDGHVCRLDTGVGKALLLTPRFRYLFPPQPAWRKGQNEPIRAAVWQGECLILRMPAEPDLLATEPSAMIVLLDLGNGRPFAYYAEGDPPYVYPPVRYWPDR
jgi:hypothetical protein